MAIHLGAVIGLTSLFGQNEIVSAICTTGLLSQWETDFDTDATVTDQAATGTHEAINPISVYLDGGSWGALGSTITLSGNYNLSIEFMASAVDANNIFAGGGASDGMHRIVAGKIQVFISNALYEFANVVVSIDVPYAIEFARVTDQLTVTLVNLWDGTSVNQTKTVSTADMILNRVGCYGNGLQLFRGYMWNTVWTDSTDTIVFQNALASGASSTVSASTVPAAGANDVTWSGLTVPGDWKTDDPRWGHSYNREDFVIADGTGTYSVGSYLPASYTSEGTLYTGTALQNLDVDGGAGVFDGSAYATSSGAPNLTASGGRLEADFVFLDAAPITILIDISDGGGSTRVGLSVSGDVDKISGSIGTQFSSTIKGSTTLIPGVEYTAAITWNGTIVKLYLNGVEDYSGAQSGTPVIGTVAHLGAFPGGSFQSRDAVSSMRVYNASSTLVHNWIVQAASDSTQTTIFDVGPSANHATITGGTFPTFWQGTADESWLAQWGGKLSGGVTIPGRTTGLAADGGALTFDNYLNAPANMVTITVPETAEMFGAAPGLFTVGDPDATDPSTIIDGDEDEIRKSDVAILVTNPAQTGACRDETDIYLGI